MATSRMQAASTSNAHAVAASKAVMRPSVQCSAVRAHNDAATRRAVLGSLFLPAMLYAPKALALIPDEEDEELVEKAKANRAKRLAEQRATTREFMKAEGLTNKELQKDLVPVQKAVYKLAEGGAQLEQGNVRALASSLNESWVLDFEKAAGTVSSQSTDEVMKRLESLKVAASKGDLKGSKQQFVSLVGALQGWAQSSGLESSLTGL